MSATREFGRWCFWLGVRVAAGALGVLVAAIVLRLYLTG